MNVRHLRAIAVLLAVSTVGACSTSDEAKSAASKACHDIGYRHGSKDHSASEAVFSAEEWVKAARAWDGYANQAAAAAGLDSRWDRLSNTVSDLAVSMDHSAEYENTMLDQDERDAALARVQAMDVAGLLRVLDQECRKAQV